MTGLILLLLAACSPSAGAKLQCQTQPNPEFCEAGVDSAAQEILEMNFLARTLDIGTGDALLRASAKCGTDDDCRDGVYYYEKWICESNKQTAGCYTGLRGMVNGIAPRQSSDGLDPSDKGAAPKNQPRIDADRGQSSNDSR